MHVLHFMMEDTLQLPNNSYMQSFPAAHITGFSELWSTQDPSSKSIHRIVLGMQLYNVMMLITELQYALILCNTFADEAYRNTHWRCDQESAFVDGGMIFRQDNKKLYVPECGYYYVSSQVQFGQYTPGKPSIYAQHQLFVETNCPNGSREIRTNAYATTDKTEWVATTFTGRLFKLCAGGTIYVKIPTGSNRACCPYGKRDGTFFSAHLVRALNCDQ